jgi:SPOR domain
MADRYQDRAFSADDNYDRGDDRHAPGQGESDPLAELARLIGQNDPFAGMGRANQQVPPRAPAPRSSYQPPVEDIPVAGPPPWMQRATQDPPRQEAPQQDYLHEDDPSQPYAEQDYPSEDHSSQDYPSSVHPLQRYATPQAAAVQDYDPPFADAEHEPDPSRYDDALYGQLDTGAQQAQHNPAYPEDPYYQDGYDDGAEEPVQKRRGGMVTVAVVLALAVVGTGAAFAYRSYIGSPRSGEPPIIKADTTPTKIIPATADGTIKVPDRLGPSDGIEKMVPREEAPVDVNANTRPGAPQSGPRVVFPPLNQNANPPSAASVAPGALPPANASNGTLPNNEPHKIKTFSVRSDQPDGAATPVATAAPPPAAKPASSAAARAAAPVLRSPSAASAPLSLAPTAQPAPEPRAQMAANTSTQIAPSAPAAGGGYLVQVSSQRNEADAQASYKALQGKFPSVLGSHSPVIKRADLGEKGVYYRAMVGPFGSPEEASQFCGNLKTAGGQCVVQRN